MVNQSTEEVTEGMDMLGSGHSMELAVGSHQPNKLNVSILARKSESDRDASIIDGRLLGYPSV